MIQAAANAGNHYVLFPELWTSGYPVVAPAKTSIANEEFIKVLRVLSFEKKIVIGGSFLLKENHNFYNRYVLITPDGEQPIVYDKIHLFKPLKEDQVLTSGKKITVKTYQEAAIGLSICYDLRFPELFRAYSAERVYLFLLPQNGRLAGLHTGISWFRQGQSRTSHSLQPSTAWVKRQQTLLAATVCW